MTLEQLRTKLESLPCGATNKDQSANGDPLNLVIVGNGVDALFAFSARGWRCNEPVDAGSSWRMTKASVLRSEHDTAPAAVGLFLTATRRWYCPRGGLRRVSAIIGG